jgi:hypothetical protein
MTRRLLKLVERGLGPIAASVPVRNWPSLFGKVYDVRVPNLIREQVPVSPKGPANTNILLDLLDETRAVPGNVAECGVYRGSTLIPVALYAKQQSFGAKFYGFDSFSGFGDTVAADVAMGGAPDNEKHAGGFSGTSQEYVQRRVDALGLSDRISLVPGFFSATFPTIPPLPWRFVHIDGDTYEAYRSCLEYFWPKLSDGGIILFDEYEDPPWPGCNLAVDEFVQANGIKINAIERNGYRKFYIRKAPAL